MRPTGRTAHALASTLVAALACAGTLGVGSTPAAHATGPITVTQASADDTIVDPTSQHQTEVEPTTAAYGNTIVTTFQVGRFAALGSGASATGWATSTDGGTTWTDGVLTGINTVTNPAGIYPRSVNMTVAYDVAHAEWIIATHGDGLVNGSYTELEMFVSRSSDGLNWSAPISVVNTNGPDKNWLTCDANVASPHYGRCYILFADDLTHLRAVSSDDGGATWTAPIGTTNNAVLYDVNVAVRPNGDVVAIGTQNGGRQLVAFSSTDGGATYSAPTIFATPNKHTINSGMRARLKPSLTVDANGREYAAWMDCRFSAGCTQNDIVWSRSDDRGVTWSAPVAVPLAGSPTTADRFVPALGVQPETSGAAAHLTVVFYEARDAACTSACLFDAVTTSSYDGGATWETRTVLSIAAGMKAFWFAQTNLGKMLADYFNVAYLNGVPWAGVALATKPVATTTDFREAIYSVRLGDAATPPAIAADAFGRTTANAWGSADVGGTWTVGGTASDFGVDSGSGWIRHTATNTSRTARLGAVSAANSDVVLRAQINQAPVANGFWLNVSGRSTSTTNEYRARVRFAANGVYLMLVRVSGGTTTTIATEVATGLSAAPGTWYRIRVSTSGRNPTTIKAKMWLDGQPEPGTWKLTATDSTAALQVNGGVGVSTWMQGTTPLPVVFHFDDLVVT